MQDFVADFIKENQFEPFDQMVPSFVVDVKSLEGFLSDFTLVRGPFNVKDKKPKHSEKVLAFIGGDCHMCIYDCGSFVDHEDASWELRGVELWMPMPELIKE